MYSSPWIVPDLHYYGITIELGRRNFILKYIQICMGIIEWFRMQFGKKHARVSFSKTIKTHECMFFQLIARETILLPIQI
jgi:hypothetical protein